MARKKYKNQYKYYVYVHDGQIEYFNDYDKALRFADQYDAIVKKCE